MIEKLDQIEEKYQELTELLNDPDIASDHKRLAEIAIEQNRLESIVKKYHRYINLSEELEELEGIIENSDDDELVKLAEDEIPALRERLSDAEIDLKNALIPKDEKVDKNTIVEIRAGTGGDESSLFVGDIFRMYVKYLERKGFKVEILASNPTGVGGYKEIIFLVEGKGAYNILKHESGVHRVQRVPDTESSGRIHTSAITVAVLPEAEEVEVKISPEDLEVETFRSTGPGGQSVNTTDSAVRIKHLPTGVVVSCQDEKSQHKNKAKALKILRARILDLIEKEREEERTKERRSLIKSGDRSERIRTYNFPQNRVSDHRIDLTLYNLDKIIEGNLDELIEALLAREREEKLEEIV